MRVARFLIIVCIALACSGCLQLHYLTQAAAGQEQLNSKGIDVDEIVEGEHLDKRTRNLLASVAKIKAFGQRFGLVRNKNYERYVWLGRPAVVWVVSACHDLMISGNRLSNAKNAIVHSRSRSAPTLANV